MHDILQQIVFCERKVPSSNFVRGFLHSWWFCTESVCSASFDRLTNHAVPRGLAWGEPISVKQGWRARSHRSQTRSHRSHRSQTRSHRSHRSQTRSHRSQNRSATESVGLTGLETSYATFSGPTYPFLYLVLHRIR